MTAPNHANNARPARHTPLDHARNIGVLLVAVPVMTLAAVVVYGGTGLAILRAIVNPRWRHLENQPRRRDPIGDFVDGMVNPRTPRSDDPRTL